MKRIIIGDIHNRNTWEKILEKNSDWTSLVILGDYSDTHDYIDSEDFWETLATETHENFLKLIELKKSRPDDVHLLFGNHDFQYVRKVRMSNMYSNYSWRTDKLMRKAYADNMHLLELVYVADGVLFSHAGVSKEWMWYAFDDSTTLADIQGSMADIKEILSDRYTEYDALELNYASGYDPHGDTQTQSPIWIRPASLWDNMYVDENIKCQVVGHTPTVKNEPVQLLNDDKSLWLCDALEYGWYLIQTENEILKFNINEAI